MNHEQVWRGEYGIETPATAEVVWNIFRDIPGWKTWNAGIERIDIDAPFSTGTWFTMKPPGEDPLRSRLVEVRENECFVDETRLGDLAITVAHRIETLGAGRTRRSGGDRSGQEQRRDGAESKVEAHFRALPTNHFNVRAAHPATRDQDRSWARRSTPIGGDFGKPATNTLNAL